MKKKTVVLVTFFLVIFIGMFFYFSKNCRNIENEKPAYFVTEIILQDEFNTNESKANEKYLNKIINVKGKVTNLDFDNNTLEIDEKILAVFNGCMNDNLLLDQTISVKGRFIGYDDLLQQFRIDEVIVEE